jgi:hypothetical protein
MPILYSLREHGHIEHVIISEPWTLQDLIIVYKQRKDAFDNALHKIHSLVDIRTVTTIPLGVISFTVKNSLERHPNFGFMAIVGASRLLRGVADTLLQLAHYDRATYFDMESEAWAFLLGKIEHGFAAEMVVGSAD